MTTLFTPFRDMDLATFPRPSSSIGQRLPFDAVRTEDAVLLEFDLPGFDPAEVDLSVDRNVLTLTAERQRNLPEGATVLVAERRQGITRRQLRFSDSLDLGSVEARFENGVLHVRIPVSQAARPQKVQIEIGAAPLETTTVALDSEDATNN